MLNCALLFKSLSVKITNIFYSDNGCARTDAVFVPKCGYKSRVRGKFPGLNLNDDYSSVIKINRLNLTWNFISNSYVLLFLHVNFLYNNFCIQFISNSLWIDTNASKQHVYNAMWYKFLACTVIN